jgi:hypothetical protein
MFGAGGDEEVLPPPPQPFINMAVSTIVNGISRQTIKLLIFTAGIDTSFCPAGILASFEPCNNSHCKITLFLEIK